MEKSFFEQLHDDLNISEEMDEEVSEIVQNVVYSVFEQQNNGNNELRWRE